LIEEQIPVNRKERKKVIKVVRVEEIGNIRALEVHRNDVRDDK
jgi:hypothetical protein